MDEHGKPVRGPIGRYGGPRPLRIGGAAAGVVALICLVLINPFGFGGDSGTPEGTPTLEAAPPGIGKWPVVPVATPTAGRTTPTPPRTSPTATPATTPEPARQSTTTPSRSSARPPRTPSAEQTPVRVTAAVTFRSCAEARAAGVAPLHRGEPGYSDELDRNGDGVACDRGNS